MILIFVEDTYSHSGWCQDLVDGLVSELKMKRMAFRFIHSIEEMNQSSEQHQAGRRHRNSEP